MAEAFVVLFTKLILCAIDDEGPVSQAKKEQQLKKQRDYLERHYGKDQYGGAFEEKMRSPTHSERTDSSSWECPRPSRRANQLNARAYRRNTCHCPQHRPLSYGVSLGHAKRRASEPFYRGRQGY